MEMGSEIPAFGIYIAGILPGLNDTPPHTHTLWLSRDHTAAPRAPISCPLPSPSCRDSSEEEQGLPVTAVWKEPGRVPCRTQPE